MVDEHSAEEIARQVKVGQALDLKIAGANFREIAKALQIGLATAHKYVAEGLLQIRAENAEAVEDLRRLEVARLDAVLVKLWSKRDQPRVADTIIRLGERRSRLMGLDLGKASADELPPPPPSSTLPTAIHITLVAPDGTKASGSGTIPAPAETKTAEGGTTG